MVSGRLRSGDHGHATHNQDLRSQGRKEHTVDALARCGDEGRGELRKAVGSRKQAMNHRSPNGATRLPSWGDIAR